MSGACRFGFLARYQHAARTEKSSFILLFLLKEFNIEYCPHSMPLEDASLDSHRHIVATPCINSSFFSQLSRFGIDFN